MKWMIRPVVKCMVEVAMLWTAKEAASSAVRVKLSIIVYTLYTPFIHLYSRTYTFVHPLYMYIRPYIHRTHLFNTLYTPWIRPDYAFKPPIIKQVHHCLEQCLSLRAKEAASDTIDDLLERSTKHVAYATAHYVITGLLDKLPCYESYMAARRAIDHCLDLVIRPEALEIAQYGADAIVIACFERVDKLWNQVTVRFLH